MTLKKVVEELRDKGVDVKFYVRKDGSIRIYEVAGKAFDVKQSRGNEFARAMLGQTISPRKTAQLQAQRPPTFDKAITSALRKVQRLFREQDTEERKARVGNRKRPTVTAKQIRQRISEVGEKQTLYELRETERYLKHLVEYERWKAFATMAIQTLQNIQITQDGVGNLCAEAIAKLDTKDVETLTSSQFDTIVAAFYDVTVFAAGSEKDLADALNNFIREL